MRRVRARDRRAGDRAALPQRLRAADAARHALRRAWRASSARALAAGARAARVRGRRPAARLRARARRRPRQRARARRRPPGAFNVASGTPRTVGEMARAAHARSTAPRAGGHRRVARRATCGTCSRRPRRAAAGLGFRAARGLRGRHARVRGRAAARMTRFAVVGHVEWIEFARVSHVPEPGEIIDATRVVLRGRGRARRSSPSSSPSSPATSTSSPRSATTSAAAASQERLRSSACSVHAAPRDAASSAGASSTSTTTASARSRSSASGIAPHGDDDLPWERLDGADAVFVSGGDAARCAQARRARLLVATPRAAETLDGIAGSTRSSERPRTGASRPRSISTRRPTSWSRPRARRAARGAARSGPPGTSRPPSCPARSSTPTAPATRSRPASPTRLGAGYAIDDALAFAARAGAATSPAAARTRASSPPQIYDRGALDLVPRAGASSAVSASSSANVGHARADRDLRREREELRGVGAREVGDRAQRRAPPTGRS